MVTHSSICYGFPGGSDSKESANLPAMQETWVQSLVGKRPILSEISMKFDMVREFP